MNLVNNKHPLWRLKLYTELGPTLSEGFQDSCCQLPEMLILISVCDLILSGLEHKLLPCQALAARCLKDSELSAAHGGLVPVGAAHTAQRELSKQHMALFSTTTGKRKTKVMSF